MKFKYFTDKDTGKSVAVNPDNVKCVKELGYGTTICFFGGEYITVKEEYMESVTRLSEV